MAWRYVVPNYVDIYYAPDIDNDWKVAPGALASINAFAPLQSGAYGSMVASASVVGSGAGGSDALMAQTFRQVSGSVRLLVFRKQNIDEYDSAFARTNRGTSYSASTTMWSAVAWGNQIIATNYLDAPQSSTGAGFSALSGSPPKARMVASNLDFVMFADVDDSGSNVYSDMVWWSGLRNPSTWAPSPATQAGNIRLLQAPGPIRALVAYGKTFVAFKDNAIIVGNYIGPQLGFSWQKVSSSIGCVGQNAVCELDGKLYFLHTSGVHEFDGQQIRPVGPQVTQTMLRASQFLLDAGTADFSYTAFGASKVQAVGDDVEGVVWFNLGNISVGGAEFVNMFGLNVRNGKWGRLNQQTSANPGTVQSPSLKTNYSDFQAFLAPTSVGFRYTRTWMFWNDSSAGLKVAYISYADASSSSALPSFTTGQWGEQDMAGRNTTVYLRHVGTSSTLSSSSDVTGSITLNPGGGSVSATFNTEFVALNHNGDARYKSASVSYAVSKRIQLAGLALGEKRSGTR